MSAQFQQKIEYFPAFYDPI